MSIFSLNLNINEVTINICNYIILQIEKQAEQRYNYFCKINETDENKNKTNAWISEGRENINDLNIKYEIHIVLNEESQGKIKDFITINIYDFTVCELTANYFILQDYTKKFNNTLNEELIWEKVIIKDKELLT